MAQLLPEGFEHLETWAVEWAMATQNMRWDKRLKSSREDLIAFYQAIQPELERILDHADKFEIGKLPEQSARLYDMGLMVAEIAPNVELYDGDPNVPHSFDEKRFIAVNGNERH
ncbi:MAG: hypothetical protein ACI909_001794 [Planctomycetota bacterium]|jgi:hypothetical protein